MRVRLDSLASLLLDAIDSGASVSFMASLDRRTAKDWWERTLDGLGPRGVAMVARDDDGVIIGCVLLQPAWAPNQPHRADVAKLLVHRRARRRGLARALMAELERAAWGAGFTLLTLDTKRGDAAEALYRSIGWTPVGTIPDYALNPDGTPCDTVVFFKAAWPRRATRRSGAPVPGMPGWQDRVDARRAPLRWHVARGALWRG